MPNLYILYANDGQHLNVPTLDTLITDAQIVCPGGIVTGHLGVRDGRIVHLGAGEDRPASREHIPARGQYLLPGLIDAHVHYGYVHPEDDYRVETGSAARGGVTCAIEFHRRMGSYLNLEERIALIERKSHIDMSLHLAVMLEEHIREIPEYAARFGVTSFKAWTSKRESGPPAPDQIQGLDEGELFETMEQVATVPGGVLCLHAENLPLHNRFRRRAETAGLSHKLRGWHAARPPFAEGVEILKAGYLAKQTGCPIYFVHIGSREALSAVEEVRSWGVTAYAETCPHFLTHTADDSAGYLAKVNPPPREAEDVEAMWDGIRRGVIDVIATDHAAKPLREKRLDGTIWEAAPGFPATFTMLSALLSSGVHEGRLDLPGLVELASAAPARIFNLEHKGRIMLGADADLVLVDLSLERTVTPELQASGTPFSIYAGRTLRGWPTLTMVRGTVIARDDQLVGPVGHGRYVHRSARVEDSSRRGRTS